MGWRLPAVDKALLAVARFLIFNGDHAVTCAGSYDGGFSQLVGCVSDLWRVQMLHQQSHCFCHSAPDSVLLVLSIRREGAQRNHLCNSIWLELI